MFGKRQSESLGGRGVVSDETNAASLIRESESEDRFTPVLSFIFAHCQGDQRPHLEISIMGKKFRGLLDTGASKSFISTSTWDILKNFGIKLSTSSVRACTVANNQSCTIIGSVIVPVQLENKVHVFELLVVPNLNAPLILGIDFWTTMKIVPNLHSKCWVFDDSLPQDTYLNSVVPRETLNSEQQQQLNNLTNRYFSLMGNKLGCTNLVSHKIEVESDPIKQRPYRVSPAIQQKIDEEIRTMLENDIIEPSTSAWSSPVLLVPKKDGSYRFCIDFRKLNKVTKRDAYPLPFISSILDKLRETRYLSSLDIKSAYWQVPVAPESREFTAFSVPGRGLFQFKRMPFGLTNAPATWQRLVDKILGPELEPNVFVYLDDVIVVSNSFEHHLEILDTIFKRFLAAGLTLSKEKCTFCKPELRYLGYVVGSNGLHVDPDKIKAILDIPTPKTVAEVRRIIGTASWYRRFIASFSTLIAPLVALLRKGKTWSWNEECECAFQAIKDALVSAPILSCPDFNLPFIVQTDASAYGIGAVLSQKKSNGEEHVICYVSRSLSRQERNYSVTERECLAVIYAIEKLRPYLEGYRFTVITDHHSLLWLNNLKEPTGRLARWAVRLQQFSFEIIHRKGKDHVVPDLLSRAVPEIASLNSNASVADKWYNVLLDKVQQNPLRYPHWRVEENRLYKYVTDTYSDLRGETYCWKTVLPKQERLQVMQDNHDSSKACHAGIYKTFERIKSAYYWPKMRADIAKYINSCRVCVASKAIQKPPAGMLGKHPDATRPWQIISCDLCGPLPRSTQGYRFIFVVQDCFSKFALLFPLRSATATAIKRIIEEHVFLMFSVPEHLICDNGVQFKSREFAKLCADYQVNILFTPYYHPQANPVERVNRVIKTMLSCYVAQNQRQWCKLLPRVGCAIRTATHEVLKLTPFFVNFGREHIISGDQYREFRNPDVNPNNPTEKGKLLQALFKDVRQRLDKAHMRSKIPYNLRHRSLQFKVGDEVYRKNHILSDAANYITAKLAEKYIGPYTISRKLSPTTYELIDEHNRNRGVFHVKDLKVHPPDRS